MSNRIKELEETLSQRNPFRSGTPSHDEWETGTEEATKELAGLARSADGWREMLERFVKIAEIELDPDACWFDHHGYCQAHGCGDVGDRDVPHCPTAAMKELVAECREALVDPAREKDGAE